MGKKQQELLAQIEENSLKLETHILSRNSHPLRKFLDSQSFSHSISFITYQNLSSTIDRATHGQQGKTEFENQLDNADILFEKTSELFRHGSLKERFQGLLGGSEVESTASEREVLDASQFRALEKIRKMYRKYRVSNIFKNMVAKLVRRNVVNSLIRKRYLQENVQGILTLIS